jgi:dolichol-phosphate mannosyltransferase
LQLTIVIPTYNEAENLPTLVSALFALPIADINLLFVDDHSPDGSGDLAEQLSGQYDGRISVLRRPGKLGLGTAYLDGFRRALNQGAQVIVQMDADFSHPPQMVGELINVLKNCDVAMGSRYINGGKLDERWPLAERFVQLRQHLCSYHSWHACEGRNRWFPRLAAENIARHAVGPGTFEWVRFPGGNGLHCLPAWI